MKISSFCLRVAIPAASFFFAPWLAARETIVRNSVEFSAALNAANAGDVITLGRGPWTDVKLSVGRGGKAENPVAIRGEVPGETILNGSEQLPSAPGKKKAAPSAGKS